MKHQYAGITIMIGPVPPPVHGAAKNFAIAIEDFSKYSKVLVISTSPRALKRSSTYHLRKLVSIMGGICRLCVVLPRESERRAYLVPDGGLGMIYTAIFVRILVWFRVYVILHHRSFNYITKPSKVMQYILDLIRSKGCNVYLCHSMKDRFESVYSPALDSMIVSNAYYSEVSASVKTRKHSNQLVIGFLSNLSREKGLDVAYQVFENLIKLGISVKFVVAGASETDWADAFIASMKRDYDQTVEVWGYVDREKKRMFFDEVDVLLFPSRYKHEAQPNVLFEAASSGVPVITTAIGCTSSDITSAIGFVVRADESFVDRATEILSDTTFLNNLSAASPDAVSEMRKLQTSSKASYSALVDLACGRDSHQR